MESNFMKEVITEEFATILKEFIRDTEKKKDEWKKERDLAELLLSILDS
jgi:hypothetical protein